MKSYLVVILTIAAILGSILSAFAQVTSPANINGAYTVGTSNLVGTTLNTNNTGTLTNLGLNQGVDFDFQGSLAGAGLWNSGLSFLNANTLQVQGYNTGLTANSADYTVSFSGGVYGLQMTMGGFDLADETRVSFFHHGVQVPVVINTYVNGAVTVTRPGNIITFAGTNMDLDPLVGGGFRVDGDGNNDTGGIGIHGAQEAFSFALPIDVAVDEVRFNDTGKNDGTGGNVTLIFNDFAWAAPDIALVKGSSFSQTGNGQSNPNDPITYTWTVTNNGGVPLTDVSLLETTFTGSDTAPVPVFSSGSGGATVALLPAGETLTYSYSYSITDVDLLAGFVDNQTTVSALPDGGLLGTDEISDLSDSSNVGDGGTAGSLNEDDVTRTTFPASIVFSPSIEAVKTADVTGFSTPVVSGETIIYTIVVTNNGDTTLNSVSLTDQLSDGDANVLTAVEPAFQSSSGGSPIGTLVASESATYTFSYSVDQSDIDSGALSNTVTANASPISGGTINDVSDDDDDLDGNVLDDPTVTSLGTPALLIVKSASPTSGVEAGDIITYTYRVTNSGNQTIGSITIADVHNAAGPPPSPSSETLNPADDIAPLGDSVDNDGVNGNWSVLGPGDTVTFVGQYTVQQSDVDTLQ